MDLTLMEEQLDFVLDKMRGEANPERLKQLSELFNGVVGQIIYIREREFEKI